MPRRYTLLLLTLLLPWLLAGCWQGPDMKAGEFADPKARELAKAAANGDARAVRRLMKDEGVNPDVHFSPGGMPLVAWPIFHRNPDGLRAMLENGADPNVAIPYPRSPDRLETNHNNAMVWAARESDPIYLKLLLDHGGDPDTRNSNGETLLLQARLSGDQWQNIQLLVERGADINALTYTYPIAWNYSSVGGFGRVYWLLQHGADPKGGARGDPVRYPIIDDIYWYPSKLEYAHLQRQCQQWLIERGIQRTPMPEHHRQMRKAFGYPHEEKDIPLL